MHVGLQTVIECFMGASEIMTTDGISNNKWDENENVNQQAAAA